ncbi:hypothetical protein Tco_1237909 [Tanacetum coccineum]
MEEIFDVMRLLLYCNVAQVADVARNLRVFLRDLGLTLNSGAGRDQRNKVHCPRSILESSSHHSSPGYPYEGLCWPSQRDCKKNMELVVSGHAVRSRRIRPAFLGHIVSAEGNYYGSAKVEAITNVAKTDGEMDLYGTKSEEKSFEELKQRLDSAYFTLSHCVQLDSLIYSE